MRPSVRMCALALALAIAVVAAVPPARAEMDKPSWTAGDYWIYSSTDVGFGLSGPGTVRYDVLGPDTVNVGGTDYASYRLRVTPNSNSSTVTFNAGDVWYRTSDLALVKGTWNVTADVPFFGRVVILATVTFTPPLGLRRPSPGHEHVVAHGHVRRAGRGDGDGPSGHVRHDTRAREPVRRRWLDDRLLVAA